MGILSPQSEIKVAVSCSKYFWRIFVDFHLLIKYVFYSNKINGLTLNMYFDLCNFIKAK